MGGTHTRRQCAKACCRVVRPLPKRLPCHVAAAHHTRWSHTKRGGPQAGGLPIGSDRARECVPPTKKRGSGIGWWGASGGEGGGGGRRCGVGRVGRGLSQPKQAARVAQTAWGPPSLDRCVRPASRRARRDFLQQLSTGSGGGRRRWRRLAKLNPTDGSPRVARRRAPLGPVDPWSGCVLHARPEFTLFFLACPACASRIFQSALWRHCISDITELFFPKEIHNHASATPQTHLNQGGGVQPRCHRTPDYRKPTGVYVGLRLRGTRQRGGRGVADGWRRGRREVAPTNPDLARAAPPRAVPASEFSFQK